MAEKRKSEKNDNPDVKNGKVAGQVNPSVDEHSEKISETFYKDLCRF